jgi:primosomal protein N' (replication factor Y) (superfamily II helicase)
MENKNKVVNVAIPVNINSLFSYLIPDEINIEDVIGKRVLVDFNGRKIRGYAVSEGQFTDKYRIKPIQKILDKQKIFRENIVDFAVWIADYYFAGIGEVLSVMIPKGIKTKSVKEQESALTASNALSDSQESIYQSIKKDISEGTNKFYLYGITGSGKTEIYIKLIEDTINKGRNVIFLVPEIALSYQTLSRLRERFGALCAVLHSNLKTSFRLGEYLKLFNGSSRIAIGPRSALFAPLENIGLIIIDEENESSYKSEESPRYHARTAALFWANYNKAVLLLGSATPSVESWYHTESGFIKKYSLLTRFGGASLPDMQIINTENLGKGKNLSLELTNEINKRLQNKEQVVLLQNRRGFSTIIRCKSCGSTINCPRCNLSLTYHRSKEKLICHHCGYNSLMPDKCPSCNDKNLIKLGAGTQKIEDEISSMFSYARIQRMDHDSLKSDFDLQETFNKIENGEIDILIGTQMIAKGLHFPNIKFVGIINADIMLNIPDYKASERTFALITQVSGRAGREGTKGFVMIQTINPEHYSIVYAKECDFEKFYNEEIQFRKILEMPPYVRLLRLVIRGKDEKSVGKDCINIAESIKKNLQGNIKLFGPAPCMLQKINNNFRYQVLLKCRKITPLQVILKKSMNEFKINRKNHLEIDVDPVDLF